MPIGNLTSQFFANVYLNVFDHHVKEVLGIKYYIRYMDDFVIFSEDKEDLKRLGHELKHDLDDKLKLSIKEARTMINTSAHGLSFLGVRIFPKMVRIRRENLKRTIRKIRIRNHQYVKGLISDQHYDASMNSLIAHVKYWKIKFSTGMFS